LVRGLGSYAGDGTGKYTMVLSRDADKKIGGTVETTADGAGSYTATFKSIVVDGASVKMAYDETRQQRYRRFSSRRPWGRRLADRHLEERRYRREETVVASGTFTVIEALRSNRLRHQAIPKKLSGGNQAALLHIFAGPRQQALQHTRGPMAIRPSLLGFAVDHPFRHEAIDCRDVERAGGRGAAGDQARSLH
jgi:hypothetical protein